MSPLFKRLVRTVFLTSLLALTFTGGIITERNGWVPDTSLVRADTVTAEADVFLEAWSLIQNRFIDRNEINSQELLYVGLKAIAEALGDTGHTRFMTPDEANQHDESIQGRFYGIGAYLGEDEEGRPIITSPIRNTPAERAGIRAGDRLLAVDGEDVTEWTVDQIVSRIKGERGTSVDITVLHIGEPEPETLTIIRDEISIPAVEWAFIPESKIAHISLAGFSASASEELAEALTEAQARGATAVVMDVRNNSGGLLDQAIRVTSQFIGDGNVLQREDASGERQVFEARPGGVALDIPLVVLVNEASASSTEIFTGAVQDNERGTVIGTRTFGTGTVLTPFTLSDGSVLLLGTSQWLTADGRTIRNRGLEPDITLDLPPMERPLSPYEVSRMTEPEFFSSNDTQLKKAVQILNDCWWTLGCEALGVPTGKNNAQ